MKLPCRIEVPRYGNRKGVEKVFPYDGQTTRDSLSHGDRDEAPAK